MSSENKPNSTKVRHSGSDPLGAIEECAKQIWKDRGTPVGTTWQDFFSEAEELLLAGRSAQPNIKPVKKPVPSSPEPLPQEILALRDQDFDPLSAAVAWGLNSLLNEHEAYCLATLLSENEFKLTDGNYRACTDNEIANLLAALAGEYDEQFLKQEGQGKLSPISREKRAAYWQNMLAQWRKEDRPLNYHDRNTIDRLLDTVAKHPFVGSVRLRNDPV